MVTSVPGKIFSVLSWGAISQFMMVPDHFTCPLFPFSRDSPCTTAVSPTISLYPELPLFISFFKGFHNNAAQIAVDKKNRMNWPLTTSTQPAITTPPTVIAHNPANKIPVPGTMKISIAIRAAPTMNQMACGESPVTLISPFKYSSELYYALFLN